MAWLTAGVTVAVAVGDSEPVADVVTVTLAEAEGEAVEEVVREVVPETLSEADEEVVKEAVPEALCDAEAVADGEGVLAAHVADPGPEFVYEGQLRQSAIEVPPGELAKVMAGQDVQAGVVPLPAIEKEPGGQIKQVEFRPVPSCE